MNFTSLQFYGLTLVLKILRKHFLNINAASAVLAKYEAFTNHPHDTELGLSITRFFARPLFIGGLRMAPPPSVSLLNFALAWDSDLS